jgi:hypothetical protein
MTNKPKKPRDKTQRAERPIFGPLQQGLREHEGRRVLQGGAFLQFDPLARAFDEVLTHLKVLAETEGFDPEIVHLLRVAQSWIVSGVDRILSAQDPHEAEESRKLLELEHLILDFAANPTNMSEWVEVDSWKRDRKFGFGKLREREELRQGLDKDQVIAARDYWRVHSTNSHPKPLKDEKEYLNDWSWSLLSSLGDLIELAQSVVKVSEIYVQQMGLQLPKSYEELPAEATAGTWRRMHWVLHSHIPEDQFEAMRQPRPLRGRD